MQKKPMIKYLSHMYDRQQKGVNNTRASLRLYLRVTSDDLAKMLAPAYRQKLIEDSKTTNNIKLTLAGGRYVENYRYGKADDRDDEEQPQS